MLTKKAEWKKLEKHFQKVKDITIQELFSKRTLPGRYVQGSKGRAVCRLFQTPGIKGNTRSSDRACQGGWFAPRHIRHVFREENKPNRKQVRIAYCP